MKDVEVIKAHNTLSPRARTNFEKRLRVAAYCRVSTDTEDQLNSYKSQVKYYTELIKSKPEWSLAGIYADEAITGTQVKKREDFQRLINDCMNGDVDMVITKSISRFARNTLDTLKYVRMLKDKGVAVFFEEENINTLTMDGELLLVILSSVAQQEVENISANVKKGLKMKMQRGELVGFQGCLGYDYNPADKTITINEEEAAVVRYIFQRYTEGAGGSVIAKELENLGYKTKRGSPKWADSTVIGIIKNEKYKGDILLGKTFTVDPISKRRLYNFGEEDQFYIREHHEPIISEEVFEAAQEILRRRAKPRSLNVDGKREKFSRKYAFSCMIECGFCGGTLTRRSWHSSSQYNKAIWQCVVSTKKGKKFCPESKGVDERTIERAFVESYRLLCQNNKDVLDEFMKRTEEALSESNAGKRLAKAEKDIHALEVKKNKLVDMRLEDTIDKETYDRKYLDLSSQIEQLQKECESLQDAAETETTMRKRVAMFRQTLEQNEVLDTFDRHIFESIVEKVIVGGYDSDGNKDPYMIVFVYKTGFKNSVDGKNFKPLRKNSKENNSPAVLCSHASNEAESMCSDSSDDTYRDSMCIVQNGNENGRCPDAATYAEERQRVNASISDPGPLDGRYSMANKTAPLRSIPLQGRAAVLFCSGAGSVALPEHQAKAHKQQQAGDPDGAHPPQGNQTAAQAGAQGKQTDDAKVVQGLVQGARGADLAVRTQGFHTAAQVSDAHGAGKSIAVHFAESLHLHSAGKGDKGVGCRVPAFRQKSNAEQQPDLRHQHQLTPVQVGMAAFAADGFCGGNAHSKADQGDQAAQRSGKIPRKQVVAQQHDIAGLGVGKHTAPGKVGIGILQTAGHGQKCRSDKGF